MSLWEEVRTRHPKFVALVDMLTASNFWQESCPSANCWHFVTKDHRYFATVHWPTYTVYIWLKGSL